jgi:hypothetical protein
MIRAALKRLLALALFAAAALLPLTTCRSTKHTVARIVTPAARPPEVFVPAPPVEPPPLTATRAPQASPAAPSPTPTVAGMPVVTTPAAPSERSPGVLYEQLVPTATAVTPLPTPRSTRVPRPTLTPTAGAAQKPGTYYEDEEGRPLPTRTPEF